MPSGQGEPHVPPQQTVPGAQQVAPQELDGAHTHWPFWQVSLAAQAFVQVPQWAESLRRLTQKFPHCVSPAAQPI